MAGHEGLPFRGRRTPDALVVGGPEARLGHQCPHPFGSCRDQDLALDAVLAHEVLLCCHSLFCATPELHSGSLGATCELRLGTPPPLSASFRTRGRTVRSIGG